MASEKDPASKVNILMLVSAKEDGHAVGIYALNHDVERDVWTLSYVNRYDDWGKGYSVEGMKALMEHAVKNMEHTRLRESAPGRTSAAEGLWRRLEWCMIIALPIRKTMGV